MNIKIEDFYADGCGPCAVVGPVLEKIAAENADVTLTKLNVACNMDRVDELGIRSVPTIVITSPKGEEIIIGSVGAERIMEAINKLR